MTPMCNFLCVVFFNQKLAKILKIIITELVFKHPKVYVNLHKKINKRSKTSLHVSKFEFFEIIYLLE